MNGEDEERGVTPLPRLAFSVHPAPDLPGISPRDSVVGRKQGNGVSSGRRGSGGGAPSTNNGNNHHATETTTKRPHGKRGGSGASGYSHPRPPGDYAGDEFGGHGYAADPLDPARIRAAREAHSARTAVIKTHPNGSLVTVPPGPRLTNTGGIVHGHHPHQSSSLSSSSQGHDPQSTGGASRDDHIPRALLRSVTRPLATQRGGRHGKARIGTTQAHADSVWHYPQARSKFGHLLEAPQCTCGAGHGLMFLTEVEALSVGHARDCAGLAATRAVAAGTPTPEVVAGEVALPPTLIPAEFHVVNTQGTKPLMMSDGRYGTKLVDHDFHTTVFPSLKPSSREEALLLNDMFDGLMKAIERGEDTHQVRRLERIVQQRDRAMAELRVSSSSGSRNNNDNDNNDNDNDNGGDGSGGNDADGTISEEQAMQTADAVDPTFASFLHSVKLEQVLYNMCFHELIRQVTIECFERGALLAKLRKAYAQLFESMPRKVKDIHTQLVVHRAAIRDMAGKYSRMRRSYLALYARMQGLETRAARLAAMEKQREEEAKRERARAIEAETKLEELEEASYLHRRRLREELDRATDANVNLFAGAVDAAAGGNFVQMLAQRAGAEALEGDIEEDWAGPEVNAHEALEAARVASSTMQITDGSVAGTEPAGTIEEAPKPENDTPKHVKFASGTIDDDDTEKEPNDTSGEPATTTTTTTTTATADAGVEQQHEQHEQEHLHREEMPMGPDEIPTTATGASNLPATESEGGAAAAADAMPSASGMMGATAAAIDKTKTGSGGVAVLIDSDGESSADELDINLDDVYLGYRSGERFKGSFRNLINLLGAEDDDDVDPLAVGGTTVRMTDQRRADLILKTMKPIVPTRDACTQASSSIGSLDAIRSDIARLEETLKLGNDNDGDPLDGDPDNNLDRLDADGDGNINAGSGGPSRGRDGLPRLDLPTETVEQLHGVIASLTSLSQRLREHTGELYVRTPSPITTVRPSDRTAGGWDKVRRVGCLKMNSRLMGFISSGVRGRGVRPLKSVKKIIKEVYDSKTELDLVDLQESDKREPMPEFVYEVLWTRYGLKRLVDQQLWDLIESAMHHRAHDPTVELFAQFAEESRTLDELSFFLALRQQVVSSRVGVLVPVDETELPEYMCLERATAVVRQAFPTRPEVQERLLEQLHALSLPHTSLTHALYKKHPNLKVTSGSATAARNRRVPSSTLYQLSLLEHAELEALRREALAQLFRVADAEGRGAITFVQFRNLLGHLDGSLTERQAARMYREVTMSKGDESPDGDGSGLMTANDFQECCRIYNLTGGASDIHVPATSLASPADGEAVFQVLGSLSERIRAAVSAFRSVVSASDRPEDLSTVRTVDHSAASLDRSLSLGLDPHLALHTARQLLGNVARGAAEWEGSAGRLGGIEGIVAGELQRLVEIAEAWSGFMVPRQRFSAGMHGAGQGDGSGGGAGGMLHPGGKSSGKLSGGGRSSGRLLGTSGKSSGRLLGTGASGSAKASPSKSPRPSMGTSGRSGRK